MRLTNLLVLFSIGLLVKESSSFTSPATLKKSVLRSVVAIAAPKDSFPDIHTPAVHGHQNMKPKISVRTMSREDVLSILLPWLYFMSISINISTMPSFVNYALNNGNTKVTDIGAKVYGTLTGIDAFFTFLSVGLVGCLSDQFGHKPFMLLSSCGLGLAYYLASRATTPNAFYFASVIDGLTSCMLSQAQAYITDSHISNNNSNKEIHKDDDLCANNDIETSEEPSTLSITSTVDTSSGNDTSLITALSRFQGLAVGLAFFFGIPIGAVISKKSIKAPLHLSIAMCALNCLLILFVLPPSGRQSAQNNNNVSIMATLKRINWSDANPFGALRLFTRNRKLFISSAAYLLLNIAQTGIQVVWINYLMYKFQWSPAVCGSTLMVVGLIVAALPGFVVPRVGKINAIKYGLLLHAAATVFLASTNSAVGVAFGMPFLAVGASVLPVLLAFLSEQVSQEEIGALQGSADTLRTMASALSSPAIATVFAYCISDGRALPGGALYVTAMFSLLAHLVFSFGM